MKFRSGGLNVLRWIGAMALLTSIDSSSWLELLCAWFLCKQTGDRDGLLGFFGGAIGWFAGGALLRWLRCACCSHAGHCWGS